MLSVRKNTGFTVVELLIVLTVIAVFSGILFPIGNQFKKQAKILSIRTDALRYQSAFLDYYEEYHRYPDWCPLEQWFDISLYFSKFLDTFGGKKTEDNAHGIIFCEFNAQELTSKNCSCIQFFLPNSGDIFYSVKTGIEEAQRGKKIYGTTVLFFIPEE